MDCEKFEPLLLDELYEELDELTSAGVKRHVSGCARCAGILNGMKATRRAAALPIMAVPIGLEERILAAAKEAQKQANVVVPFRAKASRALTVAGRWAMRPQTAMAAVFLLMIGTSAFLIRSNPRATKESAVSVTVEGSPAPVAQAAAPEAMDPNAAASAHGPATPIYTRPPPPAATVAVGDGPVDRMTNGYGRDNDEVAIGSSLAKEDKAKDQRDPIANAAPPAGAPAAPMADSMTQAPMARAGKGANVSDPASLGAAAFQARNYAEATRQYDLAAKTGDLNSELWAAESVKQGQGCAVALGRFDALSKKDAGNYFGNEASLRAARCQIAMGQTDAAKTRLVALQSSSTHAQQAQTEMNNLNQALAAKQAGGGTGVHAAAAPKKAAAPARAAPAKPSMDAEKQQRQLDRSDAY
jgi:hypothetical protein